MRTRNKLWVLIGFFAASLYPEKPVLIDHRGFSARPLSFSVNRMSPAFAALEDTRDLLYGDQEGLEENQNSVEATLLGSGYQVNFPQPQPESSLQVGRWEPLAGLTIRAQENLVASAENLAEPSIELPAADSPEWQSLPLDHRRDLLIAKYRQEPIELPTLTDKLSQVVERELALQKESTGSFSWPISQPQPQENHQDHGTFSSSLSPSSRGAKVLAKNAPKALEDPLAGVELPGFSLASIAPEDIHPRVLEGRVRMTGGLAYMGEKTHLAIFRQEGIHVREGAAVDLDRGSFSLSVERPLGHLVAELHKSDGEILGRGEIDLNLLLAESPQEEDWLHLELLLEPVEEIYKVQTLSGYSHGQNKIKLSGARLFVDNLELELEANDEGFFFDPIHELNSSFLLRAQAPDHWTGLTLGVVENGVQEFRLFSDTMIEALLSLTADVYGWEVEVLRNHAVVWGRVVHRGQALSGAKVELAGSPRAQVIYLNDMFLPDHRQSSTSQNGLFVVLMVDPGIHALRAMAGPVSLPSVLVPADAGQITYVEMEKGDSRSASVRLVDPFLEENNLMGQITVLGSEHVLDIHNEEKILFSSGSGLMMVEANVGSNYEVTRVTVPRKVREITVPMIPRQWLLDISTQRRINYDLSLGVAVGFIEGDDFEVFLEEDVEYPASWIIYFDQEGRLLDQSHGVAGGGFILLNLPNGLHQLSVLPKNQNKVYTQVIVSEPQAVNVLQQTF